MERPYRVFRRTFEASQHPAGSPKRVALNEHTETSEYQRSHRYGAEGPHFRLGFRTKREAVAFIDKSKKGSP